MCQPHSQAIVGISKPDPITRLEISACGFSILERKKEPCSPVKILDQHPIESRKWANISLPHLDLQNCRQDETWMQVSPRNRKCKLSLLFDRNRQVACASGGHSPWPLLLFNRASVEIYFWVPALETGEGK
jgi:hypothetical protein